MNTYIHNTSAATGLSDWQFSQSTPHDLSPSNRVMIGETETVITPTGVNWLSAVPRRPSAPTTEGHSSFETVHVTMVMLWQSLTYAREAADLFRHLRSEAHKADSRAVREFAESMNAVYWQEGANEQKQYVMMESEVHEDYFTKQFSQLFSACQRGIAQHHIGESHPELHETAMAYAAAAHALLMMGIEWRMRFDSKLGIRYGLSRVVKAYQDALLHMAGGEYDTKTGEVETVKRILMQRWREIVKEYEYRYGKR